MDNTCAADPHDLYLWQHLLHLHQFLSAFSRVLRAALTAVAKGMDEVHDGGQVPVEERRGVPWRLEVQLYLGVVIQDAF